MAVLGGAVLVFLITLTCVSIIGRGLNGVLHGWVGSAFPTMSNWLLSAGVGPINGDFELVEAGVAFSIFAFLPLCQITAGHASVDIFTAKLPASINRVLQFIIDIVFSILLIVIAYQLYNGMLSKQRYGDTTFLLQFPIWWAYAASVTGATVAALIAVYVACIRLTECIFGTDILNTNSRPHHE
jgi:hypothetical protein